MYSRDEVEGVDVSRPIRTPKHLALLVLVALFVLALLVPASGSTHALSNGFFKGHVYYQGGAPANNALVTVTGCGRTYQTHTTTSGYYPNDGAEVVVVAGCTYTFRASTGGCVQWYSDNIPVYIGTNYHIDATLYLNHNVRVCSLPTPLSGY